MVIYLRLRHLHKCRPSFSIPLFFLSLSLVQPYPPTFAEEGNKESIQWTQSNVLERQRRRYTSCYFWTERSNNILLFTSLGLWTVFVQGVFMSVSVRLPSSDQDFLVPVTRTYQYEWNERTSQPMKQFEIKIR